MPVCWLRACLQRWGHHPSLLQPSVLPRRGEHLMPMSAWSFYKQL